MISANDILNKRFLKVDSKENVAALLGRMEKQKKQEALIFSEKKYLGILSHRSILKSRFESKKTNVRKFVEHVSTIKPEDGLIKIAENMVASKSCILPVTAKGKVIGIVEINDVLSNIDEFGKQKLKMKNIMVACPELSPDDPIGKAIYIMHTRNLRELPIVDRDELKGMITTFSIAEKYYKPELVRDFGQRSRTQTRGFIPDRANIVDLPVINFIDEQKPATAKQTDNITKLAKMMAEKGLYTLYVQLDKIYRVNAIDILKSIAYTRIETFNLIFKDIDKVDIPARMKPQIRRITLETIEKLKPYVKDILELTIHFKEHKRQGKKHQWVIHARLTYPGGTKTTLRSQDWDVIRALRKALEELKKQVIRIQKPYDRVRKMKQRHMG